MVETVTELKWAEKLKIPDRERLYQLRWELLAVFQKQWKAGLGWLSSWERGKKEIEQIVE